MVAKGISNWIHWTNRFFLFPLHELVFWISTNIHFEFTIFLLFLQHRFLFACMKKRKWSSKNAMFPVWSVHEICLPLRYIQTTVLHLHIQITTTKWVEGMRIDPIENLNSFEFLQLRFTFLYRNHLKKHQWKTVLTEKLIQCVYDFFFL